MLKYWGSNKLKYLDADFTGCFNIRNSTSSYVFNLGQWSDTVEKCYTNTCHSFHFHVVFVACIEAPGQASWLRNFRASHAWFYLGANSYNISVIQFANNDKSSGSSNYLEVKFLVLKENIWNCLASIEGISIDLMIVDPLTQTLAPKAFKKHVVDMGLVNLLWQGLLLCS